MGSKVIKRDSGIGFLLKFQPRRPPPEQDLGRKKALALVNGLSVFTEDRGLNPRHSLSTVNYLSFGPLQHYLTTKFGLILIFGCLLGGGDRSRNQILKCMGRIKPLVIIGRLDLAVQPQSDLRTLVRNMIKLKLSQDLPDRSRCLQT